MNKIPYTISRSHRKLTGISIRISPSRGVLVSAPFWVPKRMIDVFVNEKSDWIQQSLKKMTPKSVDKISYVDGSTHLFFGEELTIRLNISDEVQHTKAEISGRDLMISIHQLISKTKHHEEIKKAILRLYLEKGVEVITSKVNTYVNILGVDYSKITLKEASSIWGSCSGKNSLSFNRKLIMAPHPIVDYVVIHEVCHLVHRDHSPRFWRLVGSLDAEYLSHRHWLRKNHHLLTL